MQYLYGVDMTTHTAATIYSLTDPQTATIDVDGDGIADFQINLNGNYDFVAADFSL